MDRWDLRKVHGRQTVLLEMRWWRGSTSRVALMAKGRQKLASKHLQTFTGPWRQAKYVTLIRWLSTNWPAVHAEGPCGFSLSCDWLQHGESASSVLSSASSANGSSLDSISLSGDERELGKVCVRVSYQEAPEQVWITLVQCCELNLPLEAAEQPRIGLKGLLALPKALRFKSSLKDWSQDVSFMETFVFTLQLQQLRRGALVLRLQVHGSRKRTVAEGVLPLTQTGSEETEHWLRLSPLSKASVCRSELHLTICFQPVNGRIQLQVLAARHLPASSTPLSQTFFVKLELHHQEQVAVKKKTRALKALGGQCQWRETFHFLLSALDPVGSLSVRLYSRSSVRRKQCLGQIQLGCDSRVPAAAEQWRDAMANPEKVVAAWHKLSAA
ncbi:Tandem C2 domains nuclear protein [Takifugu flavidus]|uniref:Tandem C2 domains nuclear protein n=1 Tax=Takifugu flavidus TaxID=433684 RepID=A0A5C6P329_9TELE|nr:Tandem C2 domains nuclear protein [Takifugu flavidus]